MDEKEIQSMQVKNAIISKALDNILKAESWDDARKIAYNTRGAFIPGHCGSYGWDCEMAKDIIHRQNTKAKKDTIS